MIEIRHSKPLESSLKEALETAWARVLSSAQAGFTRLTENDGEWKAIETRIHGLRPAKRILVLGIGGSSLGAQVIQAALKPQAEVTFLASPDPDVWASLKGFAAPEWRDKHIVIVSKSGNTLETLAWVEQIAANEPSWLKSSQVTAIFSEGSGSLQKWAAKEDIPQLKIPSDVGGRFSVLTAAGMLPAALMGLNLKEFRAGAAWALKNPQIAVQLSAEMLASFERGEWVTQMWTYSESLGMFGEWWQQLWSESLSKKQTRSGNPAPRISTPMACRGPRDQHSLLQQVMEGQRDKYIFLNRVRSVENHDGAIRPSVFPELPIHGRNVALGKILSAQAQAFEKSLAESGVNFSSVVLEALNERTLGAYFMVWQMAVAMTGEFLDVNAYDQPGVELGKKYAAQLILQ